MHAPIHQPACDRRAFIRGSMAAGAGLSLLGATSSANAYLQAIGAGEVTTGTGDQRYRVQHDWLMPPEGLAWGDTHGVCQDRAGDIYISHTVGAGATNGDAIYVFGPDGSFKRSFGSRFKGGGHGLDVREEDGVEYLYHCDVNRRRLAKTTLDGTLLWEAGAPIEASFDGARIYTAPESWNPTNVAFAPDGDLFVGDGYGRSFVHRYTKDGQWKSIVAGPGSGEGQVSQPHGLWLDDRGGEPLLAVADRANRRIQWFDLDGKHVRFQTDGMRQPCHFKTRGDLLLVPDLSSVVTLVDTDGKVVAQLGDGDPTRLRGAARQDFIPGKFVHPHSATFLADGSILVVEWVPIGRVTRLERIA
ncbi:MAG: hypothetical protein ACO3NL_02805 [Phycisphaerales bacterium]